MRTDLSLNAAVLTETTCRLCYSSVTKPGKKHKKLMEGITAIHGPSKKTSEAAMAAERKTTKENTENQKEDSALQCRTFEIDFMK